MALQFSRILRLNPKHILLRNYAGKCNGNSVKDKVGLVTGGSIGIGYAFSKALLAAGAKGVYFGDIRLKEGEEAACQLNERYGVGKAYFMKCDATSQQEMRALFDCCVEKFGQIDIVCNNAGLLQDKNWSLMIDVNVKGMVFGTFLGFEYMGKHAKGCNGGSIVNVASILGLQPFHGCPVYDGTKHFMIGFDRSMGHPYYEKLTGVKVFTICPGVTETNMIDESEKYGLQGLGNVGKILKDALHALPPQKSDDCGNCLVKILERNENGSIWVSEGGECYKVNIPDRLTLRDASS